MISFLKDQFKTFHIQYHIAHTYDPKYHVHARILTHLIANNSHKYPSRQSFHEQLERLYGLTFHAKYNVMGLDSVFKFEIKGIHGQFVSDTDLLMESINTCMDAILKPRFDKLIFDEEVFSMLQQLYAIKENKRGYASYRFKQTLDETKTRGMSVEEQIHVLKDITIHDIQTYYHTFIEDANRVVVGTGPFSDLDLINLETFYKPIVKGSIRLQYDPIHFQMKDTLKEVIPMQQKMIYQAYHVGILPQDDLYYPMLLFNEILGSSADSRLFREVRENRGLCYQIYAGYNPFDTTLTLYTGIDINKEDEALLAIQDVMKSMEHIDELELDFAKKTLIHQVTSILDQQNYPLDALMREHFYQYEIDHEMRIKKILHTSLNELKKIHNMIKPMYTYILTGESNA